MLNKTILALCLFSAHFAFADNWLIDKLERLDIKTNIPLVDLDLADGINTSLKYRYEVEPSYLGNYYTRVDRLQLNFDVNPTDYIDVDKHIGLRIKRDTEIAVVRQFPNQKEALVAPPTSLLIDRLPITAQRAIDRLEVGDLVSFRTELIFSVGASYAHTHGWLTAQLYSHYIIRGEFEVRVYRLANNRVRLQIFSTQRKYDQIGGRLSLKDGIDIFGVSVVDKYIKKLVGLTLLDLGVQFGSEKMFLMDYILKLDTPRIAKSYDSILSSSTELSHLIDLSMVNPTRSTSKILDTVTGQFADIDSVIQEELANGIETKDRTARRLFKGQNKNSFNGGHIKIGFDLLRLGNNTMFRDSHLSRITENGDREYYGFPSFTEITDFKLLFGLLGRKKGELSYNMVFREDAQQNPTEFLSLGGYLNYYDKVFEKYNQMQIRTLIQEHLPKSIYETISWGEWDNLKKRENARVVIDYYFHKSAFELLRHFSQREFETELRKYLNDLSGPLNVSESHRNISGEYCASEDLRERLRGILRRDKYTGDICYIAYHMYHAIQSHEDPYAAKRAFLGLKGNDLFKTIGIGFITSLLPQEALIDVFRFEMHWFAKDTKELSFVFGSKKERELYKLIMNIQYLMNDRSYDMRILDDALKGKN
ncbi:MAG: hypothetical protein KDD61_14035 [Bdellovibrionales bacterium]|nr:hypothetical protein [Bdellovibrionales bacterium]